MELERAARDRAATSTCSSASRTSSTRSTTSASRRPPSARRDWSTAASACAGQAGSDRDSRRAAVVRVPHRLTLAFACEPGMPRRRRRPRSRPRRSIAHPHWRIPAPLRLDGHRRALRASRGAGRHCARRPRRAAALRARPARVRFPCWCRCRAKDGRRFVDVYHERNGTKLRDREDQSHASSSAERPESSHSSRPQQVFSQKLAPAHRQRRAHQPPDGRSCISPLAHRERFRFKILKRDPQDDTVVDMPQVRMPSTIQPRRQDAVAGRSRFDEAAAPFADRARHRGLRRRGPYQHCLPAR